ncbi:hypothetical protein CALCODRAFT_557347 [Calocera cornea HHB12733]|uniref:F-box domain-containing protein n=1 Tax=Calocera cornea HHB12733 TaxID=1353952 RepID=A0A165DY74_9BASI|nr:hypothetical protein CALCODRAFT_557347 [Calocera cornea HHB12733]
MASLSAVVEGTKADKIPSSTVNKHLGSRKKAAIDGATAGDHEVSDGIRVRVKEKHAVQRYPYKDGPGQEVFADGKQNYAGGEEAPEAEGSSAFAPLIARAWNSCSSWKRRPTRDASRGLLPDNRSRTRSTAYIPLVHVIYFFDELPQQVRISHVSRRSRRLALQTATLWSTVVLKNPYFQHRVEQIILKRAKEAFLDVRIPNLNDSTIEVFPQLTGFMEKYLHRVNAICIGGCHHSLHYLFPNQRIAAPAVKTLRVTFADCYSDQLYQPARPQQLLAPDLYSPHLESIPVPRLSSDTRVSKVVLGKQDGRQHGLTPGDLDELHRYPMW